MLVSPQHFRLVLVAALFVTILIAAIALGVGRIDLGLGEITAILFAKLSGSAATAPATNAEIVILSLRLPRILAAFLVGASLAAAGAAYQVMFRNPLVSPDVLGVASGTAVGAVIGILFGWPILVMQASAFVGGLVAVVCIVSISAALWRQASGAGAVRAYDSTLVLVLVGIVIGSFFATMLALAKYVADPYNELPAITYWLLGSFSAVQSRDVVILGATMVVALLPLLVLRWRIDLLSLDDDESRTLGADVRVLRLVVILCATLLTAVAVATVGMIGWVGLVIPHAARLIVGAPFARLLPVVIILGGAFMIVVDTIGRALTSIELPPGVITSIVGAPIFIWLMVVTFRRRTA
jgi:iron complex transport system permease protein